MIKEPTISQVKKVVAKALPQAQVLNFQKASLGNINWVYSVDLINPKKKLILKVVYRKDREEQEILAKEANIIKLLNQRQIAGVPRLIDFDHSKKDVPWMYLIESYLKGKPLIECHEKLKIKDLGLIIKRIAKLITDIQQIRYKKITEFEKSRPDFKSFSKYMAHFTPKHYRVCYNSNKMPKMLIKAARDFILAQAKKIQDKEFVLNHGDVSSHNILINEGKFVGIIDFEASQTMTPEFDLVTFYHEFLWKKPELWPVLLKEYVKINRVPKDFKERLNIVMAYRSLRYLYIAEKNKIYQYLKEDINRMREAIDGTFFKTIKY